MGKHCFVIMPFSKTTEKHDEKYWNDFYSIVKNTLNSLGYNCSRSESGPYKLISNIIKNLNDADLVVAVLTDQNPNVWYELGIRHALKTGTVMLLQKEQKIPFDISAYGVICYDDGISLTLCLSEEIKTYISKLELNTCDSPVHESLGVGSQWNSNPNKINEMYDLVLKLSKDMSQKDTENITLHGSGHNRILWVDDYPSNNTHVISLFEEKNIRFDIALNTSQGLQMYRENKYDLIITDMGRGNKSDAGLELIRGLKQLNCTVPIVVFTTPNAIASYGVEATRLGAIASITGTGAIISLISQTLFVK